MAGYTIPATAKYGKTTVPVVEAFIHAGVVRVTKQGGEVIVTEEGLRALQAAMQRIRAQVAGERSGGPAAPGAAERSEGRQTGGEVEEDPSSWSEETIQAKGHKIAAAMKGAGTAADTGLQIHETVKFRG